MSIAEFSRRTMDLSQYSTVPDRFRCITMVPHLPVAALRGLLERDMPARLYLRRSEACRCRVDVSRPLRADAGIFGL